jgi:hypothetical protein
MVNFGQAYGNEMGRKDESLRLSKRGAGRIETAPSLPGLVVTSAGGWVSYSYMASSILGLLHGLFLTTSL